MTAISTKTSRAREAAREHSGEFGNQPHQDSGLVTVPDQSNGQRVRDVFAIPPLTIAARHAVMSDNAQVLRVWDNDHLLSDAITNDAIILAFAKSRTQQAADKAAYRGSDPWPSLRATDARFATVAAEAARIQGAWTAITGKATVASPTHTIGAKWDRNQYDSAVIAKGVRADIKSAYDARLLPAGTTVSVKVEKYSGGQAINVTLRGLPNSDVYEPDEDGDTSYGPRTPYAVATKRLLQEITDAYNNRDVNGQIDEYNVVYWGHVELEDEAETAWRVADAAKRKAGKKS